MINTYTRGELVRARATFTDAAGTKVDPTLVTARVRAPDGTLTTPAATKDATGEYHLDIDAGAEGTWHYRFEGTGAHQAAAEAQFTVAESRFP
jgi:uncharacterized protein YfaS (alpha-2-macroglobulin family)